MSTWYSRKQSLTWPAAIKMSTAQNHCKVQLALQQVIMAKGWEPQVDKLYNVATQTGVLSLILHNLTC